MNRQILALLLSVLLMQEVFSQTQDDDVLDYLPAIIAASAPGPTVTVCTAKDLLDLKPRSSLRFICDLNLGPSEILLPRNAELLNTGNVSVQGRLRFSGGKIDGSLLNANLQILGNAQLLDPNFLFRPGRWEIVQGKTSLQLANRNRLRVRQAMEQVVRLGAKRFEIGRMDAYFFGTGFREYVFSLPSNFHLKMAPNTVIRTFVNTTSNASIEIVNAENVRVSGGRIVGARNEVGARSNIRRNHINITTGKNVVIEGVHLSLAASDAISVRSYLLARDDGYIPSQNVTIRNNVMDSNRRNNMSVVDGQDILIEGNTFLNAGVDLPNSNGIAPRWALDIEPVGHASPDGLQKVDRVIVRNNIERGSAAGAIVAADGDDILITGNTLESGISYVAASNVKITNNVLTNVGIAAGQIGAYERSRNIGSIVSGNRISNCSAGITASNRDVTIFDNQITNCKTGILLASAEDSEVYDNTIVSRQGGGDGINAITFVKNVTIRNNTIDVDDKGFFFNGVNGAQDQANNQFLIENNRVVNNASSIFSFVRGLNFDNNTVEQAGVRLDGVRNTTFTNNVLNTRGFTVLQIGQSLTTQLRVANNELRALNDDALGHAISAFARNPAASNIITIEDNVLQTARSFNGIDIEGYNGVTVRNNTATIASLGAVVRYRGNNSLFENNKTENGQEVNDIQGINNTIR